MRTVLLLIGGIWILGGCNNAGPRDFNTGRVQNIVAHAGDQIHPAMGNGYLAWFDLGIDPNGACHVPGNYYDDDYDDSCEGVIKVMNLASGEIAIMSDVLYEETAPAISDQMVSWFCRTDNLYGLCVSPLHKKSISFYPELGYDRYNNYRAKPPATFSGKVVWYEYHYFGGDPTYYYRIVVADLRTGNKEQMIHLYNYPSEAVMAGKTVAWTTQHWDDGAYGYKLMAHNIESGVQEVLVDDPAGIFGLSSSGTILSWKQTIPAASAEEEPTVAIYFQDSDGEVTRASTDEALVSSAGSVATSDSLLAWIDYRSGDYQVVAYDLASGVEGVISPSNSLISAKIQLAASNDMVVWPDFQQGSFDLRLFSFW